MSEVIVRKNPFSGHEAIVLAPEGSTLEDMYHTILDEAKLGRGDEFDQYFKVYVNGTEIYRKYWKGTKPRVGTKVLFAVLPKGGRFGQIFKQVVILAAVVAATVLTGGAALGPAAKIGIIMGVSIGSTLLMNALIPPPENGLSVGGLGSLEGYSDSQMYTIDGQSNTARKYNTVPKVYGTHRLFPTVAANFYTTIEADPDTSELSQYFYAIYDFGLGPAIVEDFRIGNTEFQNYNELDFRLVDINKPATDEGVWDEALENSFTIYKGDVQQDSIQAVFTSTEQTAGATVDQYQVVRTLATNGDSLDSEVVVTVGFPQGLTSIGTDGSRANRNVDVRVEFAEDGTEDWYKYDDFTQVNDFETTTNDLTGIFVQNVTVLTDLDDLGEGNIKNIEQVEKELGTSFAFPDGRDYPERTYYSFTRRNYGFKKDTIYTLTIPNFALVGTVFYLNGSEFGTATNVTPNGANYDVTLTPAKFTFIIGWQYTRVDEDVAASQPGTFTQDYFSFNLQNASILRAKTSGDGVVTFSENKQTVVYGTVKFKPKSTNTLKVRVTKVRAYGGLTFQQVDALVWATNTTRFDRDPIVTDKRHVFMELRIKATDQLNGAINNLSGVVSSVLDVYNGTTWEKQRTNNPAWTYADLLTGEVNKRAISKTRLDTTSILAWANYCDEAPTPPPNVSAYQFPRFECNFVLDYAGTLKEVIGQVTSAAQASMNVVDGKYSILIDRQQSTPVQVFTPRNSWGFNSNRKYATLPDGMKVKYVDAGSTWEVRERVVYNDGFTSTTAETFEELDSFGVTNDEQAFRYGRYMLAQAKLRQENITLVVDFEHLVCTRGDYVVITQDAMSVGGTPARVTAVSGVEITIDTGFATQPATSYGYTYRSVSDGIVTSTMTITSSNTADLDGTIPSVGDLIVWGEVSQITFDCIVKSITPNADMTARLTLVEKNDAIFTAESDENIADYDPQISTVQDENITPPSEVGDLAVDANTFDCDGSQYVYFVDLSWSAPVGSVYETFEIYANNGTGFDLVDFTNKLTYRYIVDQDFLGVDHTFKVIAVSSTGSKLSLGEVGSVSATPVTKTTAPSDVDALFINITNETLQLDWELIADCDVDRYLIRFSPSLTATWESSIPLLETDKNTSLANVQGRTGSYFVKALDFNGNESSNAASAITSIPNLFNLNVIEETNDFPTFPGVQDQVVALGSELVLETLAAGGGSAFEFYPEGNYYYDAFLDLGDVYTVRLQSLIEAEGYSVGDLMVNWTTLASVPLLSASSVSDWDVETYYRGRDTAVTMSNWVTLAAIDPISAGEAGEWTAWRKFTIGDFTARIFQFRLRLISNTPTVSPRVFEAKIRSDMPDRVYSEDNLTSSVSGTSISYTPAFKGPGTTPAIQVTQDNASQGDYYVISNKSLEGFDIIFYDKNDVAVSRQFDYLAKGFGFKHTGTI